jgi:ketol-acid reductoisomerase
VSQHIATDLSKTVFFVGFGSQARAWAQCLRASDWHARVYLSRPDGPSAGVARELGFEPRALAELPRDLAARPSHSAPALVPMLCPDTAIGPMYREYLAALDTPLTLILAHGYAVYARELAPARPAHELALFAPKAIGPKIWALYQDARGGTHRLVAGFQSSPDRESQLREFARAMGFAPENLARATFEQEAVGDLLSEQGLLCGGVFTLLEWTLEAMRDAGIPEALMREECLTELELIAGLMRERGPATTFRAISQAAQCGTVAMQDKLNQSNARGFFKAQLQEVLDRRFADHFRSNRWKPAAEALTARLEDWEKKLGGAKKEKP